MQQKYFLHRDTPNNEVQATIAQSIRKKGGAKFHADFSGRDRLRILGNEATQSLEQGRHF